jgi:hypothetical protein
MAMPSGVDPEVFEDLKCVAQISTFLEAVGEPIEFWEGLCFVNAQRQFARKQIAQLTMMGDKSRSHIAQPIIDKIHTMRQQFSPLVRDLRTFLKRMPALPIDPARREMTIGFITASAKGQESVRSWLADPDNQLGKAGAKLAIIGGIAEIYSEALRPWTPPPPRHTLPDAPAPKKAEAPAPPKPVTRVVAPPPPPPKPITRVEKPAPPPPKPPEEEAVFEEMEVEAPPKPPAPPPRPVTRVEKPAPAPVVASMPLPPGVDPDILEDIRRVEQCRAIFAETHQQIEVWEVFVLVMLDRDATKALTEKILLMRKNGQKQQFNEGALQLFESLLKMRAQYGRFVRPLRDFLSTLQVGTFGKDITEMAMGFIVASARGRERAAQWLENPKMFRQEASGRYEDIISRTMKYQTTLRMSSSSGG